VEEIIPEQDFVDLLASAKEEWRPLVIKAGFDPTAPHVHLGWSVVLRKMRQFQDLGHDVVFLFGDFTAMIGDPSGKSKTRRQLSREEVLENARDYRHQISLILDPEKTRFEFNSKWCSPLTLRDTIELASRYTVTQLMQREDFRTRCEQNEPIGVHEFLYPLLQGYDSVALKCDVELGGYDQRLNLLVGRELMRNYGMAPQCLMTMPLLLGLDGKNKMSQSLGNYVGLTESPREIYGKLMSIADTLIEQYFILCTDVPEDDVKRLAAGMAS
jgi:tyrosyl-tRNA synthetase